jgi:hypothetical protein
MHVMFVQEDRTTGPSVFPEAGAWGNLKKNTRKIIYNYFLTSVMSNVTIHKG